MTLPTILTYSVNSQEIILCWKATPKSDIKSWKVYGSTSAPISINTAKGVDISGFTLIKSDIPNQESPQAAGNVLVSFSRSDLGIQPEDTFYFLLRSVDHGDNQSTLSKNDIHAVPAGDSYFVDEAGEPSNIVYKNFEFSMSKTTNWDSDRYLDLVSLLGRPAKQLRIVSKGSDIQIKINSFNSDSITVDSSIEYPFFLARGELQIKKIWFNKITEDSTSIRLFVAG
jgi:hypothetical protein